MGAHAAIGEDGWAGDAAPAGPAGQGGRNDRMPSAAREVWKAGRWDRAHGDGAGFAAGGVVDDLPPGPVLAGFAADAWAGGLPRLTDDELIGLLRAARRLTSWAAAMELAAVGDLWRRRVAEEEAGDEGAASHADDEIAAALTLTGHAADQLLGIAVALRRLPATSSALAAGDIDVPRAMVIAAEVTGLDDEHAAAVEQAVIDAAPAQTTGQLRAAARHAAIAANPGAASARKEEALRRARVERWAEHSGTAALAGRDLPPATVLAADQNLTALARQLKAAGVRGTMDALRAKVYLALLTGVPVGSLLPGGSSGEPACAGVSAPPGPAPRPGGATGGPTRPGGATGVSPPASGGPGAHPFSCAGPGATGARGPGLAGSLNLTLPLATWLGLSEAPGHAAGYGPLDAADSRAIARAIATRAGAKVCLTVTGPAGRPAAHSCARAGPRAGPTIVDSVQASCDHAWATPGYQPSAVLRHLARIRHATCTFPGCRRPAAQCDTDHTVPYEQGGRTCLCNLAPLCRRHHQAKQAHGWALTQDAAGVMTWTTPSGRRYTVIPGVPGTAG